MSSKREKVGVLLVNLGTPDGTDFWSVRRFLKEFLEDRRVVETSPLIWWPILNLIILSVRPARSGKAYAKIWNRRLEESPLKTITRAQAEKLEAWIRAGGLGSQNDGVEVGWAMRYGNPSLEYGIENLLDRGCGRILLLPLYPQYAAATFASVTDKTLEVLGKLRWQPTLRLVPPYYDEKIYIQALANSLRRSIAVLDFVPQVILVSFHGIPKAYADKGDPYPEQCVKTWALLRETMGFETEKMPMSFQSRFGPTEWLRPYTDETVT